MTGAVVLQEVTKRFGRQPAVDGVSLQVAPGERLALLGHNGAGKTTLMKLILGILTPGGGRVQVLGGAPGRAEARQAVGFLPENVAFHPQMTGWEVMRLFARLKRRPREDCAVLLHRVGLAEAAKRRVATYSKGMRQRLGLAQALLGEPRLLLLDEPTTGLDPELRGAFYDILRERAEAGSAVLLSSHLLTELEEHADRIAIVDHGRMAALGTLADLRTQAGLPVHFTVKAARGQGAELAGRFKRRVARHNGTITFDCAPSEKMAALHEVLGHGALVEDVEVTPPDLDAVYARFTTKSPSPLAGERLGRGGCQTRASRHPFRPSIPPSLTLPREGGGNT